MHIEAAWEGKGPLGPVGETRWLEALNVAGACNFPIDKVSAPYEALFNAYRAMTRSRSAAEQQQLFRGSAARFYRIADP